MLRLQSETGNELLKDRFKNQGKVQECLSREKYSRYIGDLTRANYRNLFSESVMSSSRVVELLLPGFVQDVACSEFDSSWLPPIYIH